MGETSYIVLERTDYKGKPVIVVINENKPSFAFRQALKELKFSWNGYNGFWYTRITDEITIDSVRDRLSKT